MASIDKLATAIRGRCTSRTWSQGVTLARDEAVTGESATDDEIILSVRLATRPVPCTVVLDPDELEWDCDCGGREPVCSHVAASIIALTQAREAGKALPTSAKAGGKVGYRFRREGIGLALARAVVVPDAKEVPLTTTLSALVSRRLDGPAVSPTEADLTIDSLLGTKLGGVIPGERLIRIFTLLTDHTDVRLDGRSVRVSGEPIGAAATLEDHGQGVRLTIGRDPAILDAVCFGIVSCRPDPAAVGLAASLEVLRPIGNVEEYGGRLENLPLVRDYGPTALPALATAVLPPLLERMPVKSRARNLPAVSRDAAPRIELDVMQEANAIAVLPLLVYGDPARARIDGGRLVSLGGAVPMRDEVAEKALLLALRDELNMVPGRRVRFEGKDALAVSSKVLAWENARLRSSRVAPVGTLEARVSASGGRFVVEFGLPAGTGGATANGGAGGPGFADTAAVMRAWQNGLDLVPVGGGAWARIPASWLAEHGAQVADLLAARRSDGSLPLFAVPDLARLYDDLDRPLPPDLDRLRPMIDDFRGVPSAPLPADLDATLRPYQKQGVDWLCFARDAGLGAVLADDMGLGKTIQALCALRGRALVVSPTSVMHNWAAEIRRFRPKMKVAMYHGARRTLDPDADVVLTTYPLLRIDADELAGVEWDCVVLDEAQAIKNPDSQVTRAAYRLKAAFRVAMTGTPVENRLEELWSQMHFTNPGLLGGRADFQERYAEPIAAGAAGAAGRLRDRIRPFVLRRLKRDVAPELPPRTEAVLHVELDEAERITYDAVRAAAQRDIVSMLDAGGGVLAALEALLRLRQACCHQGLLPGKTAPTSSKVERLRATLEEAAADGHKALVFSQWTSLLDLVEPHLERAGIAFTRLDGSTRDRAGVVADFQRDDGPPVMLLSLKAGGTGLNLTAADHVFLLDPWWNPAVEDQAADRTHRIGQDKPVMVYRLVATDTVEERILVLQARKRALADAALGGADRAASLTRDDLLALLG